MAFDSFVMFSVQESLVPASVYLTYINGTSVTQS